MRLDKYLADAGLGTRSQVRKDIKKKTVSVNGSIVTDPAFQVDPEKDRIVRSGEPVAYERFLYYMLNKPQGVVSATRDGLSDTVIELLSGEPVRDLFPVGRLDKDTEGLLLITNDGQLAHELLSPKKHVDKTYLALSKNRLTEKEMEDFRKGLDIGDEKKTLPAEIREEPMPDGGFEGCIAEPEEKRSFGTGREGFSEEPGGAGALYRIVIREGRYHQIKRMLEALGSEVLYLKRISMGSLILDEGLEPGEYRRLTREEIEALRGHSRNGS